MIGYVISRLSSVETKEVFFCLPLDNQSAIKRVQRRRIVECGLESSSSLKSQLKHYHQSLRTAKKQETEATSKKSPLAWRALGRRISFKDSAIAEKLRKV